MKNRTATQAPTTAMPAMAIEPRYLNRREAAEYLRRSPRALDTLRFRRQIPFIKIGDRIFYDKPDLDTWMALHKHPVGEALRQVLV
jgi:hypothetical protein